MIPELLYSIPNSLFISLTIDFNVFKACPDNPFNASGASGHNNKAATASLEPLTGYTFQGYKNADGTVGTKKITWAGGEGLQLDQP